MATLMKRSSERTFPLSSRPRTDNRACRSRSLRTPETAEAPGKPAAGPPSPLPPDFLDEPRHRWLFENQYVRVYDVRIPPGATTGFHRHAYDAVAVRVSGGLIATQLAGSEWEAPKKLDPGSVAFDADSKKPHVHRVRNEGLAEYHVILVQLLR